MAERTIKASLEITLSAASERAIANAGKIPANAQRMAGAAGGGGGGSGSAGKATTEEQDVARAARATMRSEGVVIGAQRQIENRQRREQERAERDRLKGIGTEAARKAAAANQELQDAERVARAYMRSDVMVERARQDIAKRAVAERKREERDLTVAGPHAALARAQRALSDATAKGDPTRAADARRAITRAQEQISAGSSGGGLGDDRTSRLNLFGRRSRLFGPSGFNEFAIAARAGQALEGLGPAGIAAAVGLAAFAAAVSEAQNRLNTFATAQRLGGGTARETAGLAAFGFQGEEAAQAASGFRARIAPGGDPFAQMVAARFGIAATPERFAPFDQDNLKYLQQGIAAVREAARTGEQLYVARQLELTGILKYLEVSPRLNAILDKRIDLETKLQEGGATAAATELNVALENFTAAGKDFFAVVGTPAIRGLTSAVEGMTEGFIAAADRFHGDDPEQDATLQEMRKHRASLDRNTDATDRQTNAMMIPPGDYGGERAGRAIPEGWSGMFLNRGIEQNALSRGLPGV